MTSPEPDFSVEWVTGDMAKRSDPGILARFLAKIVRAHPSYISHGEYYDGLSPDFKTWSDDLQARYESAFRTALFDPSSIRVARASAHDGSLCGVVVADIGDNGTERYWIVQDLGVAPHIRGRGVGAALLEAVSSAAKADGANRLILESGADNETAHAFFLRQGFSPVSKVFSCTL